jgi:hypothetical protein
MPTISKDDLPLSTLGIWPKSALNNLEAHWITSAAQLVGLAATDGGIASLAALTGLAPLEVQKLIAATAARLPPETARSLATPVDTKLKGLGALPRKS